MIIAENHSECELVGIFNFKVCPLSFFKKVFWHVDLY